MAALNSDYDALIDNPNTEEVDEWVEGAVPVPVNRRWCPTHRKWEINPPGRLLCGPAWAELYRMEEEGEGTMGTNKILTQIVEKIDDLVYVIERRRSVIADPPTKPQAPPPPPLPPSRARNGRGGVALP